MNQDIDGLVVVGSIEHKLLLQIKESPVPCHYWCLLLTFILYHNCQ